MQNSLEQRRAANARAAVRSVQKMGGMGMYKSYVDSLPAAIVMNGLGQAMATELASKKEHETLYDHVSAWLCSSGQVYSGKQDLLVAITTEDQSRYLRAQAEALAWLTWHKKFCRAYLEREGGRE